MEARGCSQVENACQKEDTSIEHCPDSEADRGRYSAEGFQSRIIAQFASLILEGYPWNAPLHYCTFDSQFSTPPFFSRHLGPRPACNDVRVGMRGTGSVAFFQSASITAYRTPYVTRKFSAISGLARAKVYRTLSSRRRHAIAMCARCSVSG